MKEYIKKEQIRLADQSEEYRKTLSRLMSACLGIISELEDVADELSGNGLNIEDDEVVEFMNDGRNKEGVLDEIDKWNEHNREEAYEMIQCVLDDVRSVHDNIKVTRSFVEEFVGHINDYLDENKANNE